LGDPFGEVCDGCSTECKGCDFSKQQVPACISLSEAGVENAESVGGVVTVKDLVINEGYWRATSESTNILKCYNPEACPGGVTSGRCSTGYQGPCETKRASRGVDYSHLSPIYIVWVNIKS